MESALGMDFPKTIYGSHLAGMVIFQSPATWSAQFLARTSVEQMAAHEFTHRAVNYLTGGLTPNWLDEGLAMYVAGQLPAEANADLARKAAAGKLYTTELGRGRDIDRAVKAVLGVDVASIEAAWRASLGE